MSLVGEKKKHTHIDFMGFLIYGNNWNITHFKIFCSHLKYYLKVFILSHLLPHFNNYIKT